MQSRADAAYDRGVVLLKVGRLALRLSNREVWGNYVDQQVRGFFATDFRPSRVIIIRPRQIGADHTYAISRPETKR